MMMVVMVVMVVLVMRVMVIEGDGDEGDVMTMVVDDGADTHSFGQGVGAPAHL